MPKKPRVGATLQAHLTATHSVFISDDLMAELIGFPYRRMRQLY
jgi:hypothetical protein